MSSRGITRRGTRKNVPEKARKGRIRGKLKLKGYNTRCMASTYWHIAKEEKNIHSFVRGREGTGKVQFSNLVYPSSHPIYIGC